MAIQIPTAGQIFYTQYSAASVSSIIAGLSSALVTCGWTSTSTGIGNMLVMPVTPQGLQGAVYIEDVGLSYARIRIGTADGSLISSWSGSRSDTDPGVMAISTSARTQEFCGNAHQFFTWLIGDSNSAGCYAACGVPYIRPYHAPGAITGATNAGPIVITQIAHGLTSGQSVFITDVQGNTAANGQWVIIVVDADHYSLTGSTGNGAYSAGTGLAANIQQQISRCMWMQGDTAGHSSWENFRRQLGPSNGQNFWAVVNQYARGETNTNAGAPVLKIPMGTGGGYAAGVVPNFGMVADFFDPYIAWAPVSSGSLVMAMGQLWAAFLTGETAPMDSVKLGLTIASANHDCIDLSDANRDSRGALWLLKN